MAQHFQTELRGIGKARWAISNVKGLGSPSDA